jgi:DNA-binding GntR family transcriptional regulator
MAGLLSAADDGKLTLAEHVQQRIREAILKQDLKPGDRVDQNQMAEKLEVSLAPVREALRALEAEGLVNIIPRRGAFVTQISITDLNNLYFARALLEGETIYHAVLYLTKTDFDVLQMLVDRMQQVAEANDVNTYIPLNREFHLRIYTALENQHLLQMIQQLWERSELYRYQYMFIQHDNERIHREHQAILDACLKRDQATAKAAAIEHIEGTQRELNRFFVERLDHD